MRRLFFFFCASVFIVAGTVSCRKLCSCPWCSGTYVETEDAGPATGATDEGDLSPDDPSAPSFYVAGAEFPAGYDWRRDTGYGTVDCRIFLMNGEERILEFNAGYDYGIASDGDMSRCAGGHIYSDYSTSDETVVREDGQELFRFAGCEMVTSLLLSGGHVHTLSIPRDGTGWSYRIDGVPAASSGTGIPVSGLYSDGGFPTFCYKVYADDYLGIGNGYYIWQNGQDLRVHIPVPESEVIDFRLFRSSLYLLYRDASGTAYLALDGESLPLEIPEGAALKSLDGFFAGDSGIYAMGKVTDASGNTVTLLWKSWSVFRMFEPGVDFIACYPDGEDLLAIGHRQDSVPVFYLNGEYTDLPAGYVFLSADHARISGGHYCIFLLPVSPASPPVYVIDGRLITLSGLNGYLFSIGVEE